MNAPFRPDPADPRFAGRGERLLARAEVIKSGRTLSITRGEVYAEQGGARTLCAVMQQTPMKLADTPDKPE